MVRRPGREGTCARAVVEVVRIAIPPAACCRTHAGADLAAPGLKGRGEAEGIASQSISKPKYLIRNESASCRKPANVHLQVQPIKNTRRARMPLGYTPAVNRNSSRKRDMPLVRKAKALNAAWHIWDGHGKSSQSTCCTGPVLSPCVCASVIQ